MQAQELLDSIAILEITVSKLEQESVALQYQLSQERNERRLAEYHLRHLPYPASSTFDCSQYNFTEMVFSCAHSICSQPLVAFSPPHLNIKI